MIQTDQGDGFSHSCAQAAMWKDRHLPWRLQGCKLCLLPFSHFVVLLTLYPFLPFSPEQVQIDLADFFCLDLKERNTQNEVNK